MGFSSAQSAELNSPSKEERDMRKKSVPKSVLSAVVKTQTRKNTLAANAAMYEFMWGEKPPRGRKKKN